MLLDLEKIKDMARGVESVECEQGELVFHRFTPSERRCYARYDRNPLFPQKILATSGVSLEFETDSTYICFWGRALSGGSSREFFYFDLYVNGAICAHFGQENNAEASEAREFSYRAELGEGIKRIKLHFPWSAPIRIGGVEISDASYVVPQNRKPLLISFGDSITQGYDSLYPSLTYPSIISDRAGLEVINKGVGAERFFPQLLGAYDGREPQYITVSYGTNDWNLSGREEFERDCELFFDTLVKKYPNARIFAITPIWRGNTAREHACGSFASVGEYIKEVCGKHAGVRVIDGWDICAHYRYFYADRYLHPNDMGSMILGNALSDIIREEIR